MPEVPQLCSLQSEIKPRGLGSVPSHIPGGQQPEKLHKTGLGDMRLRLSFLRRRPVDTSGRSSSVRPSGEEAKQWARSFIDLTQSKYGLALFHVFLSREFSEENIEFWLACEDFKKCRLNKLPVKAKRIFNEFIASRAPKEVNLDALTRSEIMDCLDRPDHHSFDRAQRRVQGLMEQDAYMRFLQSDLYLELCSDSANSEQYTAVDP